MKLKKIKEKKRLLKREKRERERGKRVHLHMNRKVRAMQRLRVPLTIAEME
jgi:hypothetical protein